MLILLTAFTIMRWIYDVITVSGFLLTAFGTYITYNSVLAPEILGNNLFTYSLILTFIFAICFCHYFFKYGIAKSVLNGRDHLNQAMIQITELNDSLKSKVNIEKGISKLSEICQDLSASLRNYHAPNISVCIHYVNSDDTGRPYVNVLCRNTESKQKQTRRPPAYSEKDYIDLNTDFSRLIPLLKVRHIDKLYYLNNFIPFSPFYRNSHFSSDMKNRYYGFCGWIIRITKWELPYKSAIVVPIITADDKRNRNIEGFISIDSPRLWSFSRHYDLPIVIHFASAVAPFVAKYNQNNLLKK